MTTTLVILIAAGSLVASTALDILKDMVVVEAQTRLDRLPFLVLRLARRRLRAEHRLAVHDEEWLPEMQFILQRTDGLPITRLVRATKYATSLAFSARKVSRALGPTRTTPTLHPSEPVLEPIGDRRPTMAVPMEVFPRRSAAQLLALARRGVAEAETQPIAGLAYATAHLAALRAAAAIVAARARPAPTPARRTGLPTSVWRLAVVVAPEFGDWSRFFAASAEKRVAGRSGHSSAVSEQDARAVCLAASRFVDIVDMALRQPG